MSFFDGEEARALGLLRSVGWAARIHTRNHSHCYTWHPDCSCDSRHPQHHRKEQCLGNRDHKRNRAAVTDDWHLTFSKWTQVAQSEIAVQWV